MACFRFRETARSSSRSSAALVVAVTGNASGEHASTALPLLVVDIALNGVMVWLASSCGREMPAEEFEVREPRTGSVRTPSRRGTSMIWAVHLPGWPGFRLFQLSSAALSVAMDDAAVMGAELTKTGLNAGNGYPSFFASVGRRPILLPLRHGCQQKIGRLSTA